MKSSRESNPSRDRVKDGSGLDMTSMVDVTFLLLIFFMVTAAFALQRSIEMPSPSDDRPSPVTVTENTEPAFTLVVDQFGGFFLMTDDAQYELVGKQSLTERLTAARELADDSTRLKIEVDAEARLQMLVDAMDAATIAGFAKLEVTELDSHVS